MAAPAVLKIDIVGNATKALSAFKETEDAAGNIGSKFKSLGKTLGPAIGTAAVVGFGKASFTAAQESAVATARLDQIFQSMGDSTGEASKAAQDYASSLSAKIGVEDESIMAGQAQLATFGSVSSETARMAGVFDRATAAGADLAAAGFGSIDSNAVQLGKALEDPTKGMTALAKSGVTFTDSQKDQIKAMQESGDLLGAQNVILGAVEKQVKGTAEATATSTGKMAVKFGELQETIGNKLLPVVDTLVTFFTRYMHIIIPLAAVIVGLVLAIKIYNLVMGIMAIVNSTAAATTWAWTAALLANPLVWIVIGIMALIAALILAYTKIDWFRNFVDSALDAVVGAFNWLKDAAVGVFNWIRDNWPLLLAIITGPIGIAVLLITRNFDTIKDVAQTMVRWVMDRFDDLKGFISRVAETLSGIMGAIVNAIKLPIDAATAMYDWVSDKFQAVLDFVRDIKDKVGEVIGGIAGAIKAPINAVIRAWNNLGFSLPGVDVGPIHFGGVDISTPNIPELARGGIVSRTGLALVHEGEQFSGVGRKFGNTIVVNVTHSGLGVDSPALQRDVVNALRGYVSRNGGLPSEVVTRA